MAISYKVSSLGVFSFGCAKPGSAIYRPSNIKRVKIKFRLRLELYEYSNAGLMGTGL